MCGFGSLLLEARQQWQSPAIMLAVVFLLFTWCSRVAVFIIFFSQLPTAAAASCHWHLSPSVALVLFPSSRWARADSKPPLPFLAFLTCFFWSQGSKKDTNVSHDMSLLLLQPKAICMLDCYNFKLLCASAIGWWIVLAGVNDNWASK